MFLNASETPFFKFSRAMSLCVKNNYNNKFALI